MGMDGASAYPSGGSASGSDLREGSVVPQQGSSSVSDYVVRFLEWAGRTPTFFPTEQDLSQGFIRGLSLPLCLASEHFVATAPTFPQVVSHVRAIEQACFDTFNSGYQTMDKSLPLRPIIPTVVVAGGLGTGKGTRGGLRSVLAPQGLQHGHSRYEIPSVAARSSP